MKRLTTILLAVMLIIAMSMTGEAKKKVLIESFTGTWCGPCGQNGKPATKQILEDYAGDVYVVEIHAGSGDPFNIPEYSTLCSAFGISGIPAGAMNREPIDNKFNVYPTYWESKVPALLAQQNVVDVTLFYSLNENSRQLSATIEATFLQPVNIPGELRFNLYICENNIIYTQNGQSANYSHQHVTRKMLGGAWGTAGIIPSSVKAGDKYTYTYTYTLDAAWNIENLEFYGCVNEYHATDANYIQILNSTKGEQGTPYSEVTTTGPTLSVKPSGEDFSKIFTLRNVTNEQLTFRINDEVSARTPADWTWQVVTPSGIISKSEKTQVAEITVGAGAAVDITAVFTPGATVGAGDLNLEFINKYDLKGQLSKVTMTVFSAEIENVEVDDIGDTQYSIISNMISSGLSSPLSVSASDYANISDMLPNISTLVWNCGEKGTLTASEANKISSAISDGINVFMLGTALTQTQDASVKSMLSYAGVQFLKACYQGVSDGRVNLTGYQDDPISNGFNQPGRLISFLLPALKTIGTDAYPFIRYSNVDTVVAIRSKVGDTKIVVLGFNPFVITDRYSRDDLIEKCIAWLLGSGPSISCASNLSFSSTESGLSSEKTLTIENNGKSPLLVTNVEVEYDYSVNFKVVGDLEFTIPAGGTYDLVMQFKPSYAMQYDSWIRIYSNSDNDPIKQVNLAGRGTQASAGPVISLSVQEINFVDVGVGTSDSKEFRINNTGNQPLNVTNITVPGAYAPLFTIDPTTFSVAAGANQNVTVTFNPTDVLSVETNLTISSNNKEGAVQMPVTASAIVGVEDGLVSSALLNINAVPNPFNDNSKIEFSMNGSHSQMVEIIVLEASGRTVKTIANKTFEPGTYTFDMNSSDMASGTYYIVAKTKDYTTQLPIVLVK